MRCKAFAYYFFDKENGSISNYDGTNSLTLFYSDGKYERSFYRIRYLIMLKSNIQTSVLINI